MLEYFVSAINKNFPMTYFPHGLFFFAAGIGIMVIHRKTYPFRFAKDLWVMGIFALVHAIAEWSEIFIPLQAGYVSSESLYLLNFTPQVLRAVSYVVLFIFGLRLLYPRHYLLTIFIPIGIFLFWCLISRSFLIRKESLTVLITYAEIYSHYLLLFPSSILTAWALYRQGKEMQKAKLPPKIISCLNALSVVFVFCAIINSLIVVPGLIFPANVINTKIVGDLTGFSIRMLSGFVGVAIMIVTLKLLQELNKETDRIIIQAEEDAMRFSERERISQDLHDGVIQTLYATGMMLEATVRKLDSDSLIRDQLNFCIKNLNTSLLDLRHYITGLKDEDISRKPIKILLQELMLEIRTYYDIYAELSFQGNESLQLSPNRQNHFYYVLKEFLNNIGKHTSADRIHLKLKEESNQLTITLWDNGNEAPPEEFWTNQQSFQGIGMGLRNIRERIMILHGEVSYSSPSSCGTLMTLYIPKEASFRNGDSLVSSR